MLPTLFKYIFRELGKNFLLTAIGLTAVLTTCGGLYNLTRLTDVGPKETLLLMTLVVPMCAAITLPVAALFSATATYGRLAADNEFVACRSSGINPFVLLLPCLAISVLSAMITFATFNFVIPIFMKRINDVSRESIKSFVVRTLQSGKSLEFQGQRVHARRLEEVDSADSSDDVVYAEELAFIEQDEEDIARFGSADHAVVKFDLTGKHPRIKADLVGVRIIDLKRQTFSNVRQQWLGPVELPLPFRIRPKYLFLGDLLEYRERPQDIIPKLQSQLHRTRRLVVGKVLFDHLAGVFGGTAEALHLAGSDVQVVLTAQAPEMVQTGSGAGRALAVRDVELIKRSTDETIRFQADRARLEMTYDPSKPPGVVIQLFGVTQLLQDGQTFTRKVVQFEPLEIPGAVLRDVEERYPDEALWQSNAGQELGEDVARQCKRLRKLFRKFRNEMHSEVHIRFVYSISVVVLAVLGAALSMVFRGGQLLVAFGISFVPTLFVIMMTILGKGVAKGMLPLGLGIMWTGLVVVIALDIVILKKYLPR